jgi:hypothetical protein
MAAQLSACTKEEQRAVIRILWATGVPGAEINHKPSEQYGNSALPQRSVYEWISTFRNRSTIITDEERPGRPFTCTTQEGTEGVRAMILGNRWVSVETVTHHVRISNGSAHGVSQDLFGFHKVCARWVPKQFTREHKRNCLTICQGLLNRYRSEDDAFCDALSLATRRGPTITLQKETSANGMETSDTASRK